MSTIRIKICGITRLEDALGAVNLGVDALGFIFVKKSPRYIAPEAAAGIIRQLPPYVSRVGVFADEEPGLLVETARTALVDTLQLHGNETPEYCTSLPFAIVKSLGMKPDFNFSLLDAYPAAGILLDTWNNGLQGGSGRCGDWNIARKAASRSRKIILAGGLSPTNLEEAISLVMPYGVDLNSGVEIQPGIKNLNKIRDAVAIVRNWKQSLR